MKWLDEVDYEKGEAVRGNTKLMTLGDKELWNC